MGLTDEGRRGGNKINFKKTIIKIAQIINVVGKLSKIFVKSLE